MEYKIDGKNGKGMFLISAEEFGLYERGSNEHTVLEIKLAPLAFYLQRIKAINEFFAEEGVIKNLQARRDYRNELEKLRKSCKLAIDLENSIGYESIVAAENCRTFCVHSISGQQLETSLDEVSQNDIINTFRNEDIGFIERLCDSVLRENS